MNPKDNPITSPDSAAGYKPDDFMSTLQKRLLDSQAVSSQDTNIETAINGAIAKTQEGNVASGKAITSAFDRQIGYTQDAQDWQKTGQLESTRGGATGVAALNHLNELNRREITDLEQRKQELILQGDAAASKQVSDLMIKKYEFQNAAQQQVFSNLLSMGNFGIQREQERRLAQTQNFAEQSAINSIALKYGVPVSANDTLATITAKAAPFASAEQKLEMQKTQAEINRANAEAAKALSGGASDALDPTTISVMASAATTNPNVLGTIKNPKQLSLVINAMTEMQKPRTFKADELSTMIQGAGTRSAAVAGIAADPRIQNKQEAIALVDKIYPSGGTSSATGYAPFHQGAIDFLGRPIVEASNAVDEFFGLPTLFPKTK